MHELSKEKMQRVVFPCFLGEKYETFKRVALQDPVLLKTDFVIQPILLRSVFSCGDADLFFTQEGEHAYRFAIQTHEGALVSHEAARFGWEHNTPLWVLRGQSTSGSLPDTHSFLQVSAPNVLVSILKKAEDGKGVVLRCYETDGKDTDVAIHFFKPLQSVKHTNIIEEEGRKIELEKGQLKFLIGHYAIETFKLRVN